MVMEAFDATVPVLYVHRWSILASRGLEEIKRESPQYVESYPRTQDKLLKV
jgi:hypothetical protein